MRVLLLVVMVVLSSGCAPRRNVVLWQEGVLDSAELTVENLVTDEEVGKKVSDYLQNSKAIYIEVEKGVGSFFVGIESGTGVLLVRGEGGKWSSPAFMNSSGVSFGLQFGGMVENSITFFLTNKALLSAVDGSGVRSGLGVRGAVGDKGSVASTDVSGSFENDVVVLGLGSGVHVGVAFKANTLVFDVKANDKFYNGKDSTLREIVLEGSAYNPYADGLRDKLKGLTSR